MLAIRLGRASTTPNDQQSQAEAKTVLERAKKTAVRLPIEIVERSGTSFINAAKDDPKAWGVALEFVNYRSSINQEPNTGPQPPIAITVNQATQFSFSGPTPGERSGMRLWRSGEPVPIERSARAEQIGNPNNPAAEIGPSFLLGREGTVLLDGYYFRQVVFTNVEIVYRGGVMVLDDVYFVNCRFVMPNEDKSRRFGSQVLASSPVNFNPGPG
jgi:hypothetical protein